VTVFRKRGWIGLLAVTISAQAAPVAAQPRIEDQATAGESIVVTGSRTGLETRQIGSSVSVVGGEQIRSDQALLVKDLLQDVPGVQIGNDRPGAVTGVSVRGSDNDQVLVMLDGHELGDPSNISTEYYFDHLRVGDIERIEIVRGNQSSLYGSDAIGGVINIITRRAADDGVRVNLEAEAGSFGTERLEAGAVGRSGSIDYRIGASAYRADGPSMADPNVGPAVEDDAYDNRGLSARLGWQATPAFRLDVSGMQSDTATDLDGTGEDAAFWSRVDKDEAAYTVTLTHDGGGRWHHELDFSRYDAERNYQTNGDRYIGDKDNIRFASVVDATSRLTVAFGFDSEREDTDQLTEFSGSFIAENSTDSLFAEAAVAATEAFTLTVAARSDDNERFGRFATERLTAAYVFGTAGPETKLRASFGTGAKAPGLYQLFDPFFGNSALIVEESEGYDIGVDLAWTGGTALSLTWFANDIEQEIDFQWPEGYLNLGATEARGAEAAVTVPLADRFDWSLGYAYVDSHDEATGAWLGRPRNSATSHLTARPTDRLSLTARARYRSENAASFGGTTASFVVWDLLGSFELSERLEIFGRVVNLLDEDYQYEWGMSTWDRSVFAGIRVTY
jgi:vitamin B12 transporter